MYIDDFQSTNQVLLDVNCPGCTGSGFLVWVNDIPIDNGAFFPYNQSAIITLPPGLELLNTIAIQDEKSFGCYLSDDFLDPGLFNANCTQFTDTRDGKYDPFDPDWNPDMDGRESAILRRAIDRSLVS